MTVNRKVYPPRSIWQVMRQEALERAGYRCELCGLPDASEFYNADKPHPFHREGTPYRMYLQLAHKHQYETWNRDAETLVLCPPCHGKFDAQFRRKKAVKRYAPVGLVMVWVWYKGERCLAAEARYFDDLFHVVSSFAVGFLFEVQAEIVMRIVEYGRYRKVEQGIVTLHEEGACEAFGSFLQETFDGVP
jgi:hypothetical protein